MFHCKVNWASVWMSSPRSRSCSEATETGCCGRLMLCRDFVPLQWQWHRTCSPRQLRIRHAKWQFLAHVIGSAETWFPGGILRSAFKLISTNFYEPCQAVFFIFFMLNFGYLARPCCFFFLPWPTVKCASLPPGISAVVSQTLCALDKKLVVRATPATNSGSGSNLSSSGGRFKKEIVVDGQSYLLLIRDEGGPPELQVSEWFWHLKKNTKQRQCHRISREAVRCVTWETACKQLCRRLGDRTLRLRRTVWSSVTALRGCSPKST